MPKVSLRHCDVRISDWVVRKCFISVQLSRRVEPENAANEQSPASGRLALRHVHKKTSCRWIFRPLNCSLAGDIDLVQLVIAERMFFFSFNFQFFIFLSISSSDKLPANVRYFCVKLFLFSLNFILSIVVWICVLFFYLFTYLFILFVESRMIRLDSNCGGLAHHPNKLTAL